MKSQAKIIDGKKIALGIRQQLKLKVDQLPKSPELAVILIGDDPGSHIYVDLKEQAADKVGINFIKHLLPSYITEEEVIELIRTLNKDSNINGVLVQFPLPEGMDEDKIVSAINPTKDVDGFHPENIRALLAGEECLVPGLAEGVILLLEETKEKLSGKEAVILANSEVFSQPLEYLLKQKGIKVKISHPANSDFDELVVQTDIVIVVLGRPNFIKGETIKDGAIIIDVGYNIVDNKATGDVDYQSIKNKAGWITPVPGGVGPMTVAMLLKNVVKSYEYQKK